MELRDIVASSGVQFGTSGARGLVSQMSDQVCYGYAQAFIRAVAAGAQRIVVGHDLRPSSPAIAAACAQAARDAEMELIFVGAMPTPAVAYYASVLKAPSIIITGSHIPFDRNGIKFYRPEGELTKADEQAMLAASVMVSDALQPAPLPPQDNHAAAVYIKRYVEFFGAQALHGARVAIYEHSSVARDLLRQILESLGAQVQSLGRTDTFVPIDTEAVRAEDIVQAQQWAREYRFDAILSTDGDADRPLIGDEQGNWLRGDIVGILCAQFLGAEAVVTPVSSNTAVEKCGAFKRVVRTRIGSPYVIEEMEQIARESTADGTGAAMTVAGYEANGGFLLGSRIVRNGIALEALPTRDAVLPMVALLCMARERGVPLSQLAGTLPARFTASDRIQNFATERSRALIANLKEERSRAATMLAPDAGSVVDLNEVDGLRVTFSNGDIVHLRPSGNAPELRCYAESDSIARAKQLCNDCLERIRLQVE